MSESHEQYLRRVMSGEERGIAAGALRVGLSLLEPFYSAGVTARNFLYDRGWLRAHRLQRPVISVGNLTTGGTGKTPLVRWLAEQLRARGMKPAILLRGYKSSSGLSDEQSMLDSQLNRDE